MKIKKDFLAQSDQTIGMNFLFRKGYLVGIYYLLTLVSYLMKNPFYKSYF